ncbi:phage holin family protein [Pseudoclavibacter sp. 13-3]|uniref:phage holin family protein n=1 Tax=Pseudoclavibacter sp. 13-3 TaxID=2901228 RepID=UPI001E29289C|nr:phage holin family protein [Pseudoclavibacter sp. 13-3]MCD7100775.1 phage holin family protein [Pseudoclavibacter sp. 13-3]
MIRFITQAVLTAIALWITAAIVPGITVIPFAGEPPMNSMLTYLLAAAVIALVNALFGTVLRFISIPLYIVTLGLWSFVLNGLLLWTASLISSAWGWGLTIDHFWWSAVFGAIVLGFANWLVELVARAVGIGTHD